MRAITTFGVLASMIACNAGDPAPSSTVGAPPASATASSPPSASLLRVPTENVCMVNDRDMGKPQIPVEVDGRTYFGCCAMCKEKLETQAAVRTAVDPVTGKKVDKARAVIARNQDGAVLYFENAASFERHVANFR